MSHQIVFNQPAKTTTLPASTVFSSEPPANIKATPIVFSDQNGMSCYANPPHYALVIDNAFSPAECDALLKAATDSTADEWEPAMINIGGGLQRRMPEIRDCGRIMLDSHDLAGKIYERVKPFMNEVAQLGKRDKWAGTLGFSRGHWRMTRLNERLRFLKYGPGQYFKPHCDGAYGTPSGSEESFITFQLYLSPDSPANIGGATRFWAGASFNRKESWLDVEPKCGRVLVFQHARLMHSGEEMVNGEKVTVRTDFMFERIAAPEEER